MQRFAAAGATLALPRLQGPDRPLAFLTWRPDQTLRPGEFGLSEPELGAQSVRPKLVLVPLLAFDRAGHRVGWGKGYYDRTLAALRSDGAPLLAVGLAFAVQEVEHVPAGPSDAPLDAVVTEGGWIATGAGGA
jgi:5-formyltetrahydrofolate cyclo-ligase